MGLVCVWGRVLEQVNPKTAGPRKWRPSLALVLGGTLGLVLVLPIVGLILIRFENDGMSSLLIVTLAIGAVFVTLTYLLWRLLMRPITSLAQKSRNIRLRKADAFEPLAHYGTRELRELGQSVLDMGAALEQRTAMLQAYVDHTTHELKSPLTSVSAAAELLSDENLPIQVRTKLLEDMKTTCLRMNDLMNAMRDYRQVALIEPNGDMTDLRDVDLQDPRIQIFGNPRLPLANEAVLAIIGQLSRNAFEHGATRFDICESDQGVVFADDGEGIPEAHKIRAFEPFFTTKRNLGGTGMGLAIVESLVKNGGLTVTMWHKKGGATFSIHSDG